MLSKEWSYVLDNRRDSKASMKAIAGPGVSTKIRMVNAIVVEYHSLVPRSLRQTCLFLTTGSFSLWESCASLSDGKARVADIDYPSGFATWP